MRYKRGFTLAELLIVVAIIGVLAAVAIPVFTSSLEKTKETVCLANRTSAQHIITMGQLLNSKLSETDALKMVEDSMGPLDKLCPEGGPYIVEPKPGSQLVISCQKHGKTPPVVVGENIDAFMAPDAAFRMELDNYFNTFGASSLDSSGPNHGPGMKKAIAEALNITTKFDFRVWRSGQNYQIYVFDSVEGNAAGDSVSATRYYFDSSGKQTKPPDSGSAPLKTESVKDKDGNMVDFLRLDAEHFQVIGK